LRDLSSNSGEEVGQNEKLEREKDWHPFTMQQLDTRICSP
jgi:hypothetical protein